MGIDTDREPGFRGDRYLSDYCHAAVTDVD
jgi:hypothetical protein